MKHIIYILLIFLSIQSCKDENKKIRVIDSENTELKKDTSKIETADLPILVDSTNYLIHTIGFIDKYKSRSSIYKSESNYINHDISRYNGFTICGKISNLKFQHVDSTNLYELTDKVIRITSVTYLKNIKQNIGLDYLVYKLRDQDTNSDLKLDHQDIVSLYISDIDGTNFKKLSSNLNQLLDWKVIPKLNRLYFRTITDSNKNGEFDKSDKVNYKFVDLTDKFLKTKSYDPI